MRQPHSAPAPFPKEGNTTIIRPLWRALGVETTPWGQRYWLEINGRARKFRASEMFGLSFLAEVYPDLEHWRRQFPYGVGRRIDTSKACDHFMRACLEAGEYQPRVE